VILQIDLNFSQDGGTIEEGRLPQGANNVHRLFFPRRTAHEDEHHMKRIAWNANMIDDILHEP
jgi:hypothetical protein